MSEKITQGFVITPQDLQTVREQAEKMGDASISAALRQIIREWAEIKAEAKPTQPTETH